MRLSNLSILILYFTAICVSCSSPVKNEQEPTFHYDPKIYDDYKEFVLETFEPSEVLPYCENNRWGYANKDGTVVIKPIFEGCGFFFDGYAWVKNNNKYGIIDQQGMIVLDFEYDEIGNCFRGLFPVRKEKYWGFIDVSGNVVIPFKYEDYVFQQDSTIHAEENRQWGIIDYRGNVICQPVFDNNFKFDGNLAIVSRRNKKGVYHKDHGQLIDCDYQGIDTVNDTLFIVHKYISYNKTLSGVLSPNRQILPVEFDKIERAKDDCFILVKDNRAGVVNFSGDTIINFIYFDIKWGNTETLAANNDHRWGFITFNNDTLIDFVYSHVEPFRYDLAIVQQSQYEMIKKFGLINRQNEFILPVGYYDIKFINKHILKVSIDHGRYELFDFSGQRLLPNVFDTHNYHNEMDYTGYVQDEVDFLQFKNGFAIVGQQGKMGMINEKGELVVPLKYHHLEPMNKYGYTVVQYWDKFGIIDRNGKEIIPLIFDKIKFEPNSGYYYVNKEEKGKGYRDRFMNIGYVDYEGRYYGSSDVLKRKPFDLEETISRIRTSYQNIQKETLKAEFEHLDFGSDLKGSYLATKFIVKDSKSDIVYEYFYDSSINKYGPFFIFTKHNQTENRYYYSQGKIIRWIDQDGVFQLAADAIYTPEDKNHYLAREHKAKFLNQKLENQYKISQKKNKITAICDKIDEDIKADKYKKGDSNSESMGEYYSSQQTYIDDAKQLIYSRNSTSDEGGGYETIKYYQNGELLYSYCTQNYRSRSIDPLEPGWVAGQYALINYYEKDEPIITVIEKDGIYENVIR